MDGRKPGAATEADQQATAAAAPFMKCPRCDSANTKFCYYNNYSLSQPRHFCKACKRYWTRGGMLRNVPVGGGCRKIKPRLRQPSTKLPSGYGNYNNLDNGLYLRAESQCQVEDAHLGFNGFLRSKSYSNVKDIKGFGASRVADPDPGSRANFSSRDNQFHASGLGFSPMDYMRDHSINSTHPSFYSNLFGCNYSSPSSITSAYSDSPLMQSIVGSNYELKKSMDEPSSLYKGTMGNLMPAFPFEDMHIGAYNSGGLGGGIKAENLGQTNLNQMKSLFSPSIDPSLYDWINGASKYE